MKLEEKRKKYIEKSIEQGICPVCRKQLCQRFAFPVCLNDCTANPINNCTGQTMMELEDFQRLHEMILENSLRYVE